MANPYVHRLLDDELQETVRVHSATLIVGPRASGKMTTARQYAKSVVRLDRPAEAALAMQVEPILLDEWQAVPEVLAAVKLTVDDDSRAGRFILTGSVRANVDTEM